MEVDLPSHCFLFLGREVLDLANLGDGCNTNVVGKRLFMA